MAHPRIGPGYAAACMHTRRAAPIADNGKDTWCGKYRFETVPDMFVFYVKITTQHQLASGIDMYVSA